VLKAARLFDARGDAILKEGRHRREYEDQGGGRRPGRAGTGLMRWCPLKPTSFVPPERLQPSRCAPRSFLALHALLD